MYRIDSSKNDLEESETKEGSGNELAVDERTEAEKRFARQTAEQQMRQLRAQAGTTYKQQVEVREQELSVV